MSAPKPGLMARLWVTYRKQMRGVMVLGVIALIGGILEVMAITLLVLLGKLTAEGKHEYVGTMAWFDRPIVISLSTLVLVGLGAVVLRVLIQVWGAWIDARLAANYLAEQRNRLFALFIESSWESKADTRAADLQNMLTRHVDHAVNLLLSLSGGVAALGNVVVLLASAVMLSWMFALAIFAVALALFFILRPLTKWAKRASRADVSSNSDYAREVAQAVTVAREVEVFHVGDEVKRKVAHVVEQTRLKSRLAMLTQKLLSPLYQNFVMLLAFGAMATVAMSGLGKVEVLGIIVLIMLRMTAYTQGLQSVYHHVVGKAVFLEELGEAEQKHRRGAYIVGTRTVEQIETVRLDDVHFAYKAEAPVFDGLTLEIRHGESIGVVGPSGAGKSTLIKLLLGLHTPQQGAILINGVPLRELARDNWYRRVAYVPQEPHLLGADARANIRFFRPDLSDAAVEAAARAAHIHDTLAALPQGYATDLGDQGGELSGGQRQRVSIARALVGKPDLLILDEPTSALDALSEEAIQATLKELHGRVTTLIIAHRLSMLEHCDRVLVMKDGRIEAFDTPEKLAATSNFYQQSRALLRA